jgi:hypothetical protein
MTHKEIVSKIINTIKTYNKDEHISRRYVLKLVRDTSAQLISQKLLDRTLFNEMNLYSELNCFELERVEVKQCPIIEFRHCSIIMKSVNKLPELVYSRLGSSIKEIISVDGEFQFTLVNSAQYRRNKARQVSLNDEIYAYVGSDNHLYILDKEIYTVDLSVLTMETEKVHEISTCSNDDDECKSNWDYELICPDRLVDTVFDKTLQTMGFSRQIREDQNPNGQEGV